MVKSTEEEAPEKDKLAQDVKKDFLSNKKSFTDRLKGAAKGAQSAWEKAQPYIDQARPYIAMMKPVFEVIGGIIELCWNIIQAILPYVNEEMVQIAFAVVLLFMGGQFAMTIACVQAFKTCGWSSMKKSFEQLRESYETTKATLNGDPEAKELFGAEDGSELTVMHLIIAAKDTLLADSDSEGQKAFKRMYVVMKCVDPNKILDASMGFWVGIVAVLSTLRSRMVYCVNIGASIGNSICQMLQRYIEGYLENKCSASSKTWAMFALRTSCGLVGILISLLMTRIVSAACSALQGATLLSKVIHMYFKPGKRTSLGNIVFGAPAAPGQMVKPQDVAKDMTGVEAVTMWTIACIGFVFQLVTRFNLPIWMKVPLAPLYFVESCLAVVAIY